MSFARPDGYGVEICPCLVEKGRFRWTVTKPGYHADLSQNSYPTRDLALAAGTARARELDGSIQDGPRK